MGLVQKVDSCSFLHSHASGNRETSAEEVKNTGVSSLKPAVNNERRRKGKEQASSSVPTGKGQTDDKRSKSLEARPATRAKMPCLWGRGQDVKDRRVIFGILPCVVITGLETDASMAIIACIHMLMVRSKSESAQGAVAILEEKRSEVEYLKIQIQRSLFCGKLGKQDWTLLGDTRKNFSGRTLYEITNGERKGPSRGVIQKGEPHERNPCAPKFEERTPEETSRQEECARKAAWNLARNIYKLKNADKASFYMPGQ